jgi:DNA-binding CsgD family transcriptional regulator
VRRTTRDPALRADVDLLHGAVELVAGSAESAERILLSAAHDVVATDPGRAMQLLVIASQAAALADDSTGAAEIARVAAVLRRGDAVQEDFFLDLLVGSCAYLSGDLAAAVEPLRRVIRHAEDVSQSMRLTWAARAAFYLGDDESASRFESRAVALARGAGAMGDLLPPLQRLALTDICLGRWSAAKANASEALRLAHDTGQPNLASLPSSWLALLAAYRQEASDLDEQVAAAHELLSRHPMTVAEHALLWARAVAEATAGNADVALEHLTGVTSSGIALLSSLDRIEIAVQAGDLEQAEAWLLPLVAFASGTGAPWAKARVAHCRALLADVADAGQHYEHSLTWHRAAQRPFERARTELAFGEFLRRNGGRVDARSHLRAARTIFDDLGAQHWTERTDQELRASGEKIRRAAPSSLPHLTAQELQVATLVAQGLSNREAAAQLFVSTRTVEYHLRNVFTKLGLTSRTQLAQPGALPR